MQWIIEKKKLNQYNKSLHSIAQTISSVTLKKIGIIGSLCWSVCLSTFGNKNLQSSIEEQKTVELWQEAYSTSNRKNMKT